MNPKTNRTEFAQQRGLVHAWIRDNHARHIHAICAGSRDREIRDDKPQQGPNDKSAELTDVVSGIAVAAAAKR